MTKLEKYLSQFDSRVCDTEGCNIHLFIRVTVSIVQKNTVKST
jgi:hypothetical protein